MHITTEVEHPQHSCEVGGVGLTETAHDVVEALCRLNLQASTSDITDTAGVRDRQAARRSLRRLEDAGIVVSEEIDVDLAGTVRKPYQWTLTKQALDSGVVEHLRSGSDVPLDPVEERDQRIEDLEDTVSELESEIELLRDKIERLQTNTENQTADPWDGIDPADSYEDCINDDL